ncbi:M24 family metallopeptidase [Aliikangiella maris]|uniref:Xaa-Pro peptidase family protein n=2 Tax=Aliikangiella maris TaxID=3162458 RepID=A0ABV3MTL1_9GAMM
MKPDYIKRILHIRKLLSQLSYDAIIISNVQNCQYLSGFHNSDPNVAYLVIHQQSLHLITDYRYAEQARNECENIEVIVRDRDHVTLGEQFNLLLNEIGASTVAFEKEYFSYFLYEHIQQSLQNIQLNGVKGWVEKLRMIKDETEINNIRQAAAIADESLAQLVKFIKPGMSERDVSLELEYQMQKQGSQGLSFPTIFLSGERTSLPHGIPSQRKLTAGDLIILDFGAVINGYRSDMTRTFVVGEPNEKQLDVYQAVKDAQQAGVASVKAGMLAQHPAKISKQILDASGYGKYQGEGLGHGVGLNLHEQPFLTLKSDIVLEENMVITIEPGVYIPGWGGIRIEDDVLVTATGCEILTHSPKELIVIA